ncbi:MAG: tripartite tricarboxylate transporter substrate binding protein [Proteobacteria bacterium]|nr:tripartite tricarboxylate transporter substrate binding protein [Pseudomonadota bacterium]
MKNTLFIAAILAGILGSAGIAAADNFPVKPIRIVVPFAAGGAIDIIVRTSGQQLSKELGQPVLIDNRPGAGGNIGAEIVARSQADGYTLVAGTSATHGVNPSLYAKLPYDVRRDFIAVAHIAGVPNVLVVTPASGMRSLEDLIKQARANPGKLSYGSAGSGTSLHLAGELLRGEARIDLLHVPYKGAAPANTDLLGGQINMMFSTVPVALPLIRSGKLTALAVTAKKRHFALPDVPTFPELGYASVESETWTGLFAPAGTPRDVVDAIARGMERALGDKAVADQLRQQGAEPQFMGPESFGRYVESEIARWSGVVRAAGIKLE